MALTPKLGGATASGVVLASSANPANISQVLTFTATVTPSTATGSVTFYDGTVILGRTVMAQPADERAENVIGIWTAHTEGLLHRQRRIAASSSAPLPQSVTTAAGNGTRAPISFGLPATARSVATGDFNGDGKIDFVVATLATSGAQGPLQLFLNNGVGSFTQSTVGALLSRVRA